jgi:hypothetical protein
MIHFGNLGVGIWHTPNLLKATNYVFKTSLVEILMIIEGQKRFLVTCCGRLLRSSRVYHTNFFDPKQRKKKKKKNPKNLCNPRHESRFGKPYKSQRKFGGLGGGGRRRNLHQNLVGAFWILF